MANNRPEDLETYRDYKRLQSVHTDVARGLERLARHPYDKPLRRAAALVHKALTAARPLLRLGKVPPLPALESAFADWCRKCPEPPAGAGAHPGAWAGTDPAPGARVGAGTRGS